MGRAVLVTERGAAVLTVLAVEPRGALAPVPVHALVHLIVAHLVHRVGPHNVGAILGASRRIGGFPFPVTRSLSVVSVVIIDGHNLKLIAGSLHCDTLLTGCSSQRIGHLGVGSPHIIVIGGLLRLSLVATAGIASIVRVTVDATMHPVSVLGMSLLDLPSTGTGHSMVMMMVVVRYLARQRIVALAILMMLIGVAVAGEVLLVYDGVHCVVLGADGLYCEVVGAKTILRLLKCVKLRITGGEAGVVTEVGQTDSALRGTLSGEVILGIGRIQQRIKAGMVKQSTPCNISKIFYFESDAGGLRHLKKEITIFQTFL